MILCKRGLPDLSPPSKELMKLTLEQKLAHNGHALEALKHGDRVARSGWNGKDMYLFLADGKQLTNRLCSADMPPCADSICMKTAQNTIVIGWLASQTDMIADDWKIID